MPQKAEIGYIPSSRKVALRWKRAREAEIRNKKRKCFISKYKTRYFRDLVSDAVGVYDWSAFDRKRLSKFRRKLEKKGVPINFFQAYAFFSAYRYMKWRKRTRNFSNYIGFVCSDKILDEFLEFIAKQPLSWRKKNSIWPEKYVDYVGERVPVHLQKLGRRDHIVKYDISSDVIKRNISKFL